jgi:uncharacterized RDD family membrane protein YckC
MEPNASALISGEGVRLTLNSAGVGSRTVAAAIDAAIQFVALLVLFLIDAAVVGSTDSAAVAALSLVETVLVLAGYPIVMEWATRGHTLGKLWMGLRVVRDDGGPIGFRQALVRGLAGLVLEKPGLLFPLTTIAGVITISVSAREKRIGDMMAGTVVLNERSATQHPVAPPVWVPPHLQPWAGAVDLHRLDDRLALLTRQFVSRAHTMTPGAQHMLGEDLRQRILAVIAPEPPWGVPTPTLLSSVLAERQRRAWLADQPQQLTYAQSAYSPPPATALAAEPDSPFAPPR